MSRRMAGRVLRLRDQCGAENEKPSGPGKTENEGIRRTRPKTDRAAGLILLFVGEAGRIIDATMTSTAQPVS